MTAPNVTIDMHDSDCSTHNMPAMPNGPCDCSLEPPVKFWIIEEGYNDMMQVDRHGEAPRYVYASDYEDLEKKLNKCLATLQSIKDAGDDVVEPSTVGFIRARAENGNKEDASVAEFIDTLLSAYKRVCVEKDLHYMKAEALHERAEKAEAELAALRLELGQITGEIPYGN